MNAFTKVIKSGKPWKSAYDAVSAVFIDEIKGKSDQIQTCDSHALQDNAAYQAGPTNF